MASREDAPTPTSPDRGGAPTPPPPADPMSMQLYAHAMQIGDARWAVVLDESKDGPTISARLLCELGSRLNALDIASALNGRVAAVNERADLLRERDELREALRALVPVADEGIKAIRAAHAAQRKPHSSRLDMHDGALARARAVLRPPTAKAYGEEGPRDGR